MDSFYIMFRVKLNRNNVVYVWKIKLNRNNVVYVWKIKNKNLLIQTVDIIYVYNVIRN